MEPDAVTPHDFHRLEGKVDKLADAVEKLVLIEDRQTRHEARLDRHEAEIREAREETAKTNRRFDRFVALLTGGAFVVGALFELAKFAKDIAQ